jgi:hypothetical protein
MRGFVRLKLKGKRRKEKLSWMNKFGLKKFASIRILQRTTYNSQLNG